MPKHRHAEFTQEVFGVMAGTGHAFLPESLLTAMRERERVSQWSMSCPTVWVGIDPPAHGKSAMGMCAYLVHRTTGQVVVIGMAAVDAQATEVHQYSWWWAVGYSGCATTPLWTATARLFRL